jgi:hypothetical protein
MHHWAKHCTMCVHACHAVAHQCFNEDACDCEECFENQEVAAQVALAQGQSCRANLKRTQPGEVHQERQSRVPSKTFYVK